jgi:hypothetical protein
MNKKFQFSEFLAGGQLGGCFAILISFSTSDSIDRLEAAAIFFSVFAIPLLVTILGVLTLGKGGVDIKRISMLPRVEKLALAASILAFVFYFWSFSWVGFIACILSMAICSMFLSNVKKNLPE